MPFNLTTFLFIFIKMIFFFEFLSYIKDNQIIKNDNLINESLYQTNQNFTNSNPNYKIIAIYYPDFNINKFNNKETNQIINNSILIEKQIELAKNHGLFGFGIMYNYLNSYNINYNALNCISKVNQINFPFFIIINNNINKNNVETSLIEYLNKEKEHIFISLDNIQNYFISENYIKYREKSILGIYNSSKIRNYLVRTIRDYLISKECEKILILTINNEVKNFKYNDFNIINYPSFDIGLTDKWNRIYFYNYYYYNLFKNEINSTKPLKNFLIVNGGSPEKFYIMLKKYLNALNNNNETLIIFNAWNDNERNLFLEPNNEYGYAYINYFSKAIYNIEEHKIYDLNSLKLKCKIAVQVHIFYDDLTEDIINKTNNIPALFDLYITITNSTFINYFDNYIKHYSKCHNYQILLVENQGRDIMPFIKQMKSNYKQYKYICHIHSKKSLTVPEIGLLWRNYLFNNLLGNINITSEILNDFETNRKLGFIFPETFYGIIQHFFILTKETEYWLKKLSYILFDKYKIGKLIDFPAGNMFWSKTKAIFQIFIYDLSLYFPDEKGQINDTIMHGIERIWLYLVKFNFFKYKIIFNIF